MKSLPKDAPLDSFSAAAPDDRVDEVAGPPFTPLETAGGIGLGVLALLMAGMMPLLLSALAEEHRLGAAGIGQAAMLEALSTGLTTGLAGIFLKPRRLRLVAAFAAIGVALVDLATARASGGSVFAMRALAGLPEGLLLWIAIGLITRTRTPERWAAVLFTGMGVTQLGFATLLTVVVLPRFGASGGYVAVGAATGLALPLALIGPSSLGHVHGAGEAPTGAPPPKGWLALAGTLAIAASLSCVGVYIVPLGLQAGLGLPAARLSIPVALGCQIGGAAIATVLAGHIRYIHVFWASGLVFLATWITYAGHPPAWLFLAVTGLSALGGAMAAPFLVPMTIEADPSRRAAMQSGAIQLLSGALGPLVASLAVRDRDAHGVLVLGALLQILGLAVATILHRSAVVAAART
jgi:hypothetical protein